MEKVVNMKFLTFVEIRKHDHYGVFAVGDSDDLSCRLADDEGFHVDPTAGIILIATDLTRRQRKIAISSAINLARETYPISTEQPAEG